MKVSLAILLLSVSLISVAQIDLTQLDGTISEDEKAQFQLLGENGVSEISAYVDADYIKINVKSDTMYVASLCFCDGNEKTIVMHASSALGQLNYLSAGDGTWNSSEQFDWKVREKDMSKKTIEKRREYLDNYGWVANTVSMGRKGHVEFIVKKELFTTNQVFLAAGLMLKANPEEIIPLPTRTSGDCAALSLVAGNAEKNYRFEPETWFKINF